MQRSWTADEVATLMRVHPPRAKHTQLEACHSLVLHAFPQKRTTNRKDLKKALP